VSEPPIVIDLSAAFTELTLSSAYALALASAVSAAPLASKSLAAL
jgi:hypothetical protein